MEYRVEKKFLCTDQQLQVLQARLSTIMYYDQNQENRMRYQIRSIYFDTYGGQFFFENDAGIDDRKKYRIRAYNCNKEFIRLEVKSKVHGYTHKEQCQVTQDLYRQLVNGKMPDYQREFPKAMNEFYLEMAQHLLHPVAIIEYERTAFVYPEGNVRITFDRNIAVSRELEAFWNNDLEVCPIMGTGQHILEVKYDEFLPDTIAQLLEIGSLQQTTFSKYYMASLFLRGERIFN